MAAAIREYVETGRLGLLDRLEGQVSPEDLFTTVPGIGEVTAARIVQWRDEHGPFRRAEDLMKVKGIGEKSFDKLRPYVKVGKSR